MDKKICDARVFIGGIQYRCELEPDHIGRHQDRRRQDTPKRNWYVILWDENEVCPYCHGTAQVVDGITVKECEKCK